MSALLTNALKKKARSRCACRRIGSGQRALTHSAQHTSCLHDPFSRRHGRALIPPPSGRSPVAEACRGRMPSLKSENCTRRPSTSSVRTSPGACIAWSCRPTGTLASRPGMSWSRRSGSFVDFDPKPGRGAGHDCSWATAGGRAGPRPVAFFSQPHRSTDGRR